MNCSQPTTILRVMRPDIAATAFSQVGLSFLNVHRGTSEQKHLLAELLFSNTDIQSAENFFIPTVPA